MYKPIRHLVVSVVLVASSVIPIRASEEESPATDAIKEAITILEARKAQAEKKADQDKISEAIAALKKLSEKADHRDKPTEITPALLKKKFRGRATYNQATGALSLVYDFTSKDQLQDFELNDFMPVVFSGTLRLDGGVTIQHVVKFKTLRLNVRVMNKGDNGVFLACERAAFFTSSDRGDHTALAIRQGGKTLEDLIAPRFAPGAWWPVELVVSEKRLSLKVGNINLGKAVKTELAGQASVFGGKTGNAFSNLVLEGMLDEEWAKNFFAP